MEKISTGFNPYNTTYSYLTHTTQMQKHFDHFSHIVSKDQDIGLSQNGTNLSEPYETNQELAKMVNEKRWNNDNVAFYQIEKSDKKVNTHKEISEQ